MDSGIKYTLSTDNTELCSAVDMLQRRDAIQRLERATCRNTMKFNMAKYKVLHMSQGNPKHKLRDEWNDEQL